MDSFAVYIFYGLILVTHIALFSFFERIIKIEFQSYPVFWKLDGQPVGLKSIFKDIVTRERRGTSRHGRLMFMRLFLIWLFRTPSWLRRDAKAYRLLLMVRLLASLVIIEWGMLLQLQN